MDGVAIGADRIPAGKGDIANVSGFLIRSFGTKNPRVTSRKTDVRLVQIKQCHPKSIEASGGSLTYTMIKHQPTLWGLDERRRQPHFVGIPPRSSPRLKNQFMVAPVVEIR